MNIPLESVEELVSGVASFYCASDELSQSLLTDKPIACTNGCSWCCHFHVTVKPYELVALVNYYHKLSAEDAARFRSLVEMNCSLIDAAADDELLHVNLTCPFLQDSGCAVYDSRPFSCRVAHSCSASVCEQAYRNPESDVEVDHYEEYTDMMRSFETEFEEQVGEYYDVSDYSMNPALKEALSDPSWLNRFLDGDDVFSDKALSRI